jgi:hypothetical protein
LYRASEDIGINPINATMKFAHTHRKLHREVSSFPTRLARAATKEDADSGTLEHVLLSTVKKWINGQNATSPTCIASCPTMKTTWFTYSKARRIGASYFNASTNLKSKF